MFIYLAALHRVVVPSGMKICSLALALCSSVLPAFAMSSGGDPLQAKHMSVFFQQKANESSAWIRCAFSREQDIVLNFRRRPVENFVINSYDTRLIDRAVKLTVETVSQGELVHTNGDDATPWHINGTYIGGNHGCTSVIEITVADDALSVRDIGSAWKDESGATFYLIDVPAPGLGRLLSENLATYPFWKFTAQLTGTTLTRVGDGPQLAVSKSTLTQLWPCARLKEQKFLANGKTPLQADKVIECEFLDIIEEYDIINPASVLAEVIRHPGVRPNFTAAHLDGVINNKLVYRISPNASVVLSHQAVALQPFNLEFMGFIQQAVLQKPAGHRLRYYIPKTAPFQLDGADYDFQAIQPFDEPPKAELRFSGEARGLPDRFVQFLASDDSEKTKNRLGFAFGYSPTNGLTALDNPAWRRHSAGFIYTSAKTYPFALDETTPHPVPAGTRFDCVAYRQYFDPSRQDKATCVFWHQEGDKTIVHVDYHRPVNGDTVRLPPAWAGRPFRVVEKTDSITIDAPARLRPEGLKITCGSDYGSATLEVSAQ